MQLMICDAICESGHDALTSIGVEVAPFLTGEVARVLEQFFGGDELLFFRNAGLSRWSLQ